MTAMTNDLLTALAREFAEETRNGILGLFPQPLPDSMEVLIKNDQEYYGRFLRWLTRRYCLVEKSNALTAYKAMSDYGKEKGVECAECANYAARVWMKRLFPEIAKEVEE